VSSPSCLYPVHEPAAEELLEVPEGYELTLVAAFGETFGTELP
jgi:hypothetical protein